MNQVLFVVNPKSGARQQPDEAIGLIHELWRPTGIEYAIVRTTHRGEGAAIARQAAAEGVPMVVAAGGDGTLNEVASGLVGSRTALGIIPLGSGNGFARNMGVPLVPRAAIRQLQTATIKQIDVGVINGRYFFCGAGLGFDVVVAAEFDRFGKRGPLPYFLIGVRQFFRYHPEPLEARFDGRELRGSPLVLYVANGPQYGSGAVIAPTAQPEDGLLDLCWLAPSTALETLRNLPRLFRGTIHRWKAMQVYRAREVTLHRNGPGYVHTDGEVHWETADLQISLLPGALRVATGAAPSRSVPGGE